MKQALINYSKNEISDEVYTPDYAIFPLLKYIPKHAKIWCPFDTEDSNYVKLLKENGNDVIHTHINYKQDFFEYQPNDFDIIISNPPYSIKDKILERCYELGKPFALLLPITTLEGIKRNKLYRKYGLQLIVLDRRIEFYDVTPGKETKTGCWFNTSYFCWKLLPKDIIFESINKQ
jgi:hypothetical protein